MNKNMVIATVALLIVIAAMNIYTLTRKKQVIQNPITPEAPVGQTFAYDFNSPGILEESGNPNLTSSPYWWLNSGGLLYIDNGIGHTIYGNLDPSNIWHQLYGKNNARDTDNGNHPQNLFRLVTRSSWMNFSEQVYFKIDAYNLSPSPYRSESNGVLLFSRYQDGETLYYSGLRVDGTVVIKKKYKGTYYTLAQVKVFPGTYDRTSDPNLLPLHEWIGLRSDIATLSDGSVSITLYTDQGDTVKWTQVLQANDNGANAAIINQDGRGGIRTDFMDVSFKNFKIFGN